jgi:hypothetical protein
MNINLGTFNKDTARIISKQFSQLKRNRSKRNKFVDFDIKFKSRTYGNRAVNGHDGTHRMCNSDKLAVYLCIKERRDNLIWISTSHFDTYQEAQQYGMEETTSNDGMSRYGRVFKIVKVGNQYRVRIYMKAE